MERFSSESWLKGLPNTLKMHLKCADIDLETYRHINRVQLAHSVLSRKRIYLDTMAWIGLREVALGRSVNPIYVALLGVLKDACRRERVICPLSYSAVSELLNQDDRKTRLATARVMDELSQALCIQRFDYLLTSELEYFLCKNLLPDPSGYTPEDLAWTKVAFFVGQSTLSTESLTPDQLLAFQKAIDDAISSLSVEALAGRMGSKRRRGKLKTSAHETANTLNIEKVKPAHLFANYQEYVNSEVRGGLEAFESLLGRTMSRLVRAAGYKGPIGEEDLKSSADMLRNLIANAYQSGAMASAVPQVHINASLHALVRYDQNRKYKPNDLEDFRHAGAALPYCHVFLTDKSLAHLLRHPPASLDAQYACAVFSDPEEALDYIRSIAT